MLTQFRCIVMVAFTLLGAFKSLEETVHAEERSNTTTNNYVLMLDGSSPSPVPIPILMKYIKNMLPIVEYANFLKKPTKSGFKHQKDSRDDKEGNKVFCLVCQDCIEGSYMNIVAAKECVKTVEDETEKKKDAGRSTRL
ncbi:ATP-dependent DNA helicase [Actinidia chinensis var. chinensis]|uniref:ATP-dependent DNA helicase n=1 Tax=Actinidia chinensis var. chinensis TaxID=1590841 RepID=A0A2R6Q8P4_ACTCC|nr:ATP-dependent DNA helicase [Actinidia chinensis var. chinensis]